MFNKNKGIQMPPDLQAKEKLALYVYEYLMHLGAKNSAQTFLSEIRWEKGISLGEAPGFLLSWWNIFWDLYSAAPERRDQYDSSAEAKTFHDFNPCPSHVGQHLQDAQNISQGSFFNSNAQPGSLILSGQNYSRYHSPNSRSSSNNNLPPNSQMVVESGRSLNPLNRLTPPGNRLNNSQPVTQGSQSSQSNMGQIPFNVSGSSTGSLRGVSNQPSIASNSQISNSPMSPMSLSLQQQQSRWGAGNGTPVQASQSQTMSQSNPSSSANYTSSSPVSYGVPITHQGPGTPIIPSPQDANTDMNYGLIKNVQPGIQFHDQGQNISHMVSINNEISHHSHLNGEIMDTVKHSPISNIAAGRHQDDHSTNNPLNVNDLGSFSGFADGSVGLF